MRCDPGTRRYWTAGSPTGAAGVTGTTRSYRFYRINRWWDGIRSHGFKHDHYTVRHIYGGRYNPITKLPV
ncbi:MAG: hypothetical protein K0R31_1221 [Clostridiales bacterium]|jgi:hypothetical protein|nr:hypothetical protein [Clostridiales bacterium]